MTIYKLAQFKDVLKQVFEKKLIFPEGKLNFTFWEANNKTDWYNKNYRISKISCTNL